MLPVTVKSGGKLEYPSKDGPADVTERLELFLNSDCEIDDDVTLRDIFVIAGTQETILSPMLTNSPHILRSLIQEGLSDFEYIDTGIKLDEIRLSRSCSVSKSYDKNDSTPYFHFGTELLGVSLEPSLAGDNTFAIEMSPTYELIDIPFRIVKEFTADDYRGSYDPTQPPLLKATSQFTLLEVLRGVFSELSFHGSPTERDSAKDELTSRISDLDNEIVETHSFSDLRRRLHERS